MSQYDPMFDLKVNKVTVTYISWSTEFALYLEDYLMYEVINIIPGDNESV